MTGSWLTTADHKRLGRMYVLAALGFLVVAGVAGVLSRAELDVSAGVYGRFVSAHAISVVALALGPLWIGLATYVVPLQIGAARLAFPRLQAAALWAYVGGGLLHLISYTGSGPTVAGLQLSRFVDTGSFGTRHTDLWVMSLLLVTLATIVASANLLATLLAMRTEGLTLGRLPMFSWSILVTAAAWLVAAPVFAAGLVLLYIDQHFFGIQFFGAGVGGTQVIWQHTLWLYGRPDVYLLAVPGLGAACDIVVKAARRPLANADAARGAIAAAAFLSFGAWAAGTKVSGAVVVPTYSLLSAAVVLPVGALFLLWADTLRRSTPRFDMGLVFVGAALVTAGAAVVAPVIAAVKSVDGGTTWSAGEVNLVVFGLPTLLAVGALHHWGPKLWGRRLGDGAGGLQVLAIVGGTLLASLGLFLAGWDGQSGTANVKGSGFIRLAAAGEVVSLLGVALVALTVLARTASRATAAGDAGDGDGLTLEWATTSPPAPYNFDTIPEVRSATPLADLADAQAAR
jgi:cytochrome c oxidase subunit I